MRISQKAESIEEYLAEPDIHDERYQEFTGTPLVLIFAVALTVGHALNLYLLLWQGTPPALNFLLHVILTGVAGLLVYLLRKAELDTRLAMLMFIASAVMGPVATAGVVLTALQGAFYIRYRSSFEEWFQSLFPKGTQTQPEEIVEALELGRDENPHAYHVIPFMDVMQVGNEAQKRQALSKMASGFSPRFAPAFKRALADDSSSIRIQAATAITKIENKFHDKLMKIVQLHREFPKNPTVKRALAEHYDNYAFTGLLDEERERVNREKAREIYLEYLQMRPDDMEVRLKLGRLLVRSGMVKQALEWFKRSLDEGYASDSLKIWYLECLFDSGHYEELRNAASTFRIDLTNYKDLQPEMVESIHLWTQAGANQKLETA